VAVDAALRPRLFMGSSKVKPWLIDGNNTRRRGCIISSDNGRIIVELIYFSCT
jgi:flagellar biosynthesis/type III secretory pathway protein FliH